MAHVDLLIGPKLLASVDLVWHTNQSVLIVGTRVLQQRPLPLQGQQQGAERCRRSCRCTFTSSLLLLSRTYRLIRDIHVHAGTPHRCRWPAQGHRCQECCKCDLGGARHLPHLRRKCNFVCATRFQ